MHDMTHPPLIDTPVTDHDWQALAWQRLCTRRPVLRDWPLAKALADAAAQAIAAKEARFGRQVQRNGFGYVPVRR